jgi:hypothetical protein
VWLALESGVGTPTSWANEPPEAILTATEMLRQRQRRQQQQQQQ